MEGEVMLRFGKAIGLKQVRNQLGTIRGAKSFLRGAQFFKLRSIVLNYVQHIFQGRNIFQRGFAPL